MNNKQIDNGLLINEWQLGAQLNVAVTNGTRDKFNLLLSLLSNDARDFSQFSLPKATQHTLTELELRDSFALSDPQPLVNAGISLKQAERLNIAIHKQDISDIRLQSLLNNEAILSRQNRENFDRDVVDNLSFLSQTRLKAIEKDESLDNVNAPGIDHQLMDKYQAMNKKPLTVKYM